MFEPANDMVAFVKGWGAGDAIPGQSRLSAVSSLFLNQQILQDSSTTQQVTILPLLLRDLPILLEKGKRGLVTVEDGRFDLLQLSRSGRRESYSPRLCTQAVN